MIKKYQLYHFNDNLTLIIKITRKNLNIIYYKFIIFRLKLLYYLYIYIIIFISNIMFINSYH